MICEWCNQDKPVEEWLVDTPRGPVISTYCDDCTGKIAAQLIAQMDDS